MSTKLDNGKKEKKLVFDPITELPALGGLTRKHLGLGVHGVLTLLTPGGSKTMVLHDTICRRNRKLYFKEHGTLRLSSSDDFKEFVRNAGSKKDRDQIQHAILTKAFYRLKVTLGLPGTLSQLARKNRAELGLPDSTFYSDVLSKSPENLAAKYARDRNEIDRYLEKYAAFEVNRARVRQHPQWSMPRPPKIKSQRLQGLDCKTLETWRDEYVRRAAHFERFKPILTSDHRIREVTLDDNTPQCAVPSCALPLFRVASVQDAILNASGVFDDIEPVSINSNEAKLYDEIFASWGEIDDNDEGEQAVALGEKGGFDLPAIPQPAPRAPDVDVANEKKQPVSIQTNRDLVLDASPTLSGMNKSDEVTDALGDAIQAELDSAGISSEQFGDFLTCVIQENKAPFYRRAAVSAANFLLAENFYALTSPTGKIFQAEYDAVSKSSKRRHRNQYKFNF